jgi:hypothetical protein
MGFNSEKSPTIGRTLTEMPANRAHVLDNVSCVYCNRALEPGTRTKEHVIGRRFVPKGKLDGQWNLILWACRDCNGLKADLENDLSAITMLPDLTGQFGHDDPSVASEAGRKANRSTSRRTGKPVKDSREKMSLKMQLAPGCEITFGLISPPQADRERVFQLAQLQVMAFFYMVTFDQATRRGGYWPGGFFPVLEAGHRDWGNVVHRSFMDAVVSWEPRVLAGTADGFFKIAMRRHPLADCWSWALEWNRQYRVVGFCGDRAAAEAVFATFPKLEMATISQGPDHFVRSRVEKPLAEADDKLLLGTTDEGEFMIFLKNEKGWGP